MSASFSAPDFNYGDDIQNAFGNILSIANGTALVSRITEPAEHEALVATTRANLFQYITHAAAVLDRFDDEISRLGFKQAAFAQLVDARALLDRLERWIRVAALDVSVGSKPARKDELRIPTDAYQAMQDLAQIGGRLRAAWTQASRSKPLNIGQLTPGESKLFNVALGTYQQRADEWEHAEQELGAKLDDDEALLRDFSTLMPDAVAIQDVTMFFLRALMLASVAKKLSPEHWQLPVLQRYLRYVRAEILTLTHSVAVECEQHGIDSSPLTDIKVKWIAHWRAYPVPMDALLHFEETYDIAALISQIQTTTMRLRNLTEPAARDLLRTEQESVDNATEPKPAVDPAAPELVHSASFLWLIVRGVKYEFTKGQQAGVIRVLFEERTRGGGLDGLAMTEEAIGDAIGASEHSFRIQKVFEKHPALNVILRSPSKGIWALYLSQAP